MQRAKRMSTPLPNSAAIVRHRLLHDRIMRRHVSAVIALSPPEQHRQAVQIAHCFKNYYLAEITYRADCQMTVAVIRSVSNRQPVREIWIDSTGNVSVYRRDMGSLPLSLLGRVVVIPGLLFIVLAVVFLAVCL